MTAPSAGNVFKSLFECGRGGEVTCRGPLGGTVSGFPQPPGCWVEAADAAGCVLGSWGGWSPRSGMKVWSPGARGAFGAPPLLSEVPREGGGGEGTAQGRARGGPWGRFPGNRPWVREVVPGRCEAHLPTPGRASWKDKGTPEAPFLHGQPFWPQASHICLVCLPSSGFQHRRKEPQVLGGPRPAGSHGP